MSEINRFKPAVRKTVLFSLAGLFWLSVGVMLVSWARLWLSDVSGLMLYTLAFSGILLGSCVHTYGFSRIAAKNIERIKLMDEKICIFALISWKSYLIVLVMMTMGFGLRHSSIPKEYLSVLYTGIGSALMLSSVAYLNVLITHTRTGRQ